jgi:hypothetical protein
VYLLGYHLFLSLNHRWPNGVSTVSHHDAHLQPFTQLYLIDSLASWRHSVHSRDSLAWFEVDGHSNPHSSAEPSQPQFHAGTTVILKVANKPISPDKRAIVADSEATTIAIIIIKFRSITSLKMVANFEFS